MPETKHSLRRAVHRTLVRRIAIGALGLAVVLGVVTYFVIRDEVGVEVIALARRQVDRFSLQSGHLLDRPELPDSATLQKQIDLFSQTQPSHHWGEFVVVEIRDLDHRLLAQRSDPEDRRLAETVAAMPPHSRARLTESGFSFQTRRVGGRPYILIQEPMRNLAGDQVGWLRAAFKLSDPTIHDLRMRLLRGILIVVAIVLVTALLLYPILMELVRRLTRFSANLLEANLDTLQVIGSAVAKRDNETQAHSARVTLTAVRLAEHLGLSRHEIQRLIKGALLHDVGKIAIHDEILLKPGRLTEEEFEVMKTHVTHGADIVHGSAWLGGASNVVRYHHEKFDGSGYLVGLAGEQIPRLARIFALADVFDALTSERPYKEAKPLEETMAILEDSRGSHFDPQLLDAFEMISSEVYNEITGRDAAELNDLLGQMVGRYFSGDLEALEP